MGFFESVTGAGRVSPAMQRDLGAQWIEHMRRGEFEAAWKISDRVMQARAGTCCSHRPLHERWLWPGHSFEGKRVLLCSYHGLGDTIQFVRYARLVKKKA